jgi:hypothetical protein
MDNIIINVKMQLKKGNFVAEYVKKPKKSYDVVNVEKLVHILLKTNNLS